MPAQDLEQNIWQLVKAGKLNDAAAACDQLNEAFPDYGSGWSTSSRVAISLNEPLIALKAIERALLITPGEPVWLLQKMASLAVLSDLTAANAVADEIAKHDFATAYHASSCAVTLTRLERFADAEFHYQRAVDLEPDSPIYQFNLASAQRFLGKLDAARESLDRTLQLNPVDCEAQLLRSELNTQTESDNNVDSLHSTLEKLPEEHPGRVQLYFALAKELDDLQRYEESFQKLQLGASERRSKLTYQASHDLHTMATIREQFGKDVIDSAAQGFINAEPIFVVGMPRSGTVLVDRILSSHSVVQSVGEPQSFGLELMNQCEKAAGVTPKNALELLAAAREIDFAALGEAYLNRVRPADGEYAHFVDKLPLNFMYASLIHLALPKAKIVLTERDPMDNCYTAFRTLFTGACPYTYDLDELANYFVEYRQLIDHWRSVMPGVMHTVRYEDLVGDSRPVVEGLLDHCDLSLEDQCFDHRAEAVGKWRNYSDQLQPVADILQRAGYG